jgi:hypothetical protein
MPPSSGKKTQEVPLKYWYMCTKLHSITSQQTVTLIFIAKRAAKLPAHTLNMVAEPQRASLTRHICANTP